MRPSGEAVEENGWTTGITLPKAESGAKEDGG